ncbi:hypothetical protein KT99_20546 [Shewanella benthica KT99]|uniref:Uncharacterized protein n=1 Tax=Shewanella benthica KT99 TaxID=314608 RepID=A9D6X1_9GAMM|nr:hypothetical protein KT99_20546 [Shewanella benthica KT99]
MQFIRLVLVFCSKLGKVSAAITSEQAKKSQNARLKHKINMDTSLVAGRLDNTLIIIIFEGRR